MLVASQFFFALVTIIFWALARSTAYIREEENKKDGVANRRVSEAITSIGGFCTGWSAGAVPLQWLKQAPNFTPPSARLTISAGPGHNLYLNLCSRLVTRGGRCLLASQVRRSSSGWSRRLLYTTTLAQSKGARLC